MTPVDNTSHTLSFIGNVSDKPALAIDMYKKKGKAIKGVIALVICFLAGVAAAAILLYTFF